MGLNLDVAVYYDDSLLGGASLALDPEGDYVSLLGYDVYLTGGDLYPLGGESLGASTEKGHTRASKEKQAT